MALGTRLVAVVAAGLLGLMAGAAAAFVVDTEAPGKDPSAVDPSAVDPSAVDPPAVDPPAVDPLGLGIEMTNLECTGKPLLVISQGSTSAALAGALADNRESEVSYLRTAESCDTLYGREGGRIPEYAAYMGPFNTISEACELRLSVLHRGDVATVLKAGNDQAVRCVCYGDAETYPVLTPGMATEAATSVWARALQQLLVDIDDQLFPESQRTGVYDRATEARVRELQEPIGETGIVDATTWRSIRDQICDTYEN